MVTEDCLPRSTYGLRIHDFLDDCLGVWAAIRKIAEEIQRRVFAAVCFDQGEAAIEFVLKAVNVAQNVKHDLFLRSSK